MIKETIKNRNKMRLRKLRKENPKWNNEKNIKWKEANREKYLAHKAIENAIKAGNIIKQSCERCGAHDLVHAHHDDYNKRYDVKWLCPLHHKERHRELLEST
jgi:hypothetical protein